MPRKAGTEDKQYLARILYTRERLEAKAIALRIGMSETTIRKWSTEQNWKALRQRLLLNKEDQLNALYEQLEVLNEEILASDARRPDSKQAEVQVKLTAAIRNLETDLAIADLVESGMRFVKHLQKSGTEADHIRNVADQWHSFIQASIKK